MTPKWKHSIRAKLTSIIMVTSGTAVLLTFLGFTVSGLHNFQKRLEGDLTAIAQMVAVNTAPALASGDQQAAPIPLADSAKVLSPATPANRIETSHAGTGPREASAVSSNEPRIALAADSRGEAALPAPDDAEGRQVRKSIESIAGRQDHDLIETFELASDAPSVLLAEDDRGENRHAS
jgi:hypothetical protein